MRNILAVPVAVFITISLVGCGGALTTPTSTNLSTIPSNTDTAVSDVYIIPSTYTLDSGTYTWNSGTYTWDFIPVNIGTNPVADSGTYTWNSSTRIWDTVSFDSATDTAESLTIEPKTDVIIAAGVKKYMISMNQ